MSGIGPDESNTAPGVYSASSEVWQLVFVF